MASDNSINNSSSNINESYPNPQKNNGYVGVANEIVEALCRKNLNAYETRILWAIFRKTYGWNKKTDVISYSQFTKLTGIKSSHIARTLKSLITRNIIKAFPLNHVIEYQFQKNYLLWDNPLLPNEGVPNEAVPNQVLPNEVLPNEDQLLPNEGVKLLPNEGDTKDNKYTITKPSKNTNKEISFENFINDIKEDKKYEGLDIEYQLKKWEEYWSEGSRKLKKPKTAFRNWLEKALEYKSNTGSSPKTFKGNGNKQNTANELSDENSKMLEELNRL